MSKPIQPTIPNKRKRRRPARSPYQSPANNSNPLSSLNLANVLSHFLTVRSAIKELSTSLQRMENILDSLYQMFEIAQTVITQKQRTPGRPPLRLIPPRTPRKSPFGKRESSGAPSTPPSPIPENIDIGQIMALLQSPWVQNLLSQWMQQLPLNDNPQQKQG